MELINAILNKNINKSKKLVKRYINVNVEAYCGCTALTYACASYSYPNSKTEKNMENIALSLINKGCIIDIDCSNRFDHYTNKPSYMEYPPWHKLRPLNYNYGQSPIEFAIITKKYRVLSLLLKKGCKINNNIYSECGDSLLDKAYATNSKKIILKILYYFDISNQVVIHYNYKYIKYYYLKQLKFI